MFFCCFTARGTNPQLPQKFVIFGTERDRFRLFNPLVNAGSGKEGRGNLVRRRMRMRSVLQDTVQESSYGHSQVPDSLCATSGCRIEDAPAI